VEKAYLAYTDRKSQEMISPLFRVDANNSEGTLDPAKVNLTEDSKETNRAHGY
jgi:hypothetical protein